MSRMPWLVLGCLLVVASPARATDPLPSGSMPAKGLRFSTPAEAAGVLKAIETLNKKDPPFLHPDESMEYRIAIGPLGILSGTLTRSIQRVTVQGRVAYRIRETIRIWNRTQGGETLLDATSLLPLRFTTKTRRGRSMVVHEIIWDHIEGLAYGEVTRNGKVSSRHHWVLGQDLPTAALDPLSTLLVYRLQCSAAAKASPWQATVLDDCINWYTCKITPLGEIYRPQPNVADVAEAIRVDWHMTPDTGNEGERRATLVLGTAAPAVPLSGLGKRWGFKGIFTLSKYSREAGKK